MGSFSTLRTHLPSCRRFSQWFSWTSLLGKRKVWKEWKPVGPFLMVLPSSSSLVCGMPSETFWRCCPWGPWMAASTSYCSNPSCWLPQWWWYPWKAPLRAPCRDGSWWTLEIDPRTSFSHQFPNFPGTIVHDWFYTILQHASYRQQLHSILHQWVYDIDRYIVQ